jgi:iron complex transport system substrate-binding protein
MPRRPHVPRLRRLLLAGAALVLVSLAEAGAPAVSAEFTDAAGRRVALPDRVGRVLPAERNAEVLLYALAPDKLAGLERPAQAGKRPGAPVRPPVLRFRPGATVSGVMAAARNARAELILDAGPVTPERAAFANEVTQRTGIPYVLVDDSFERMPAVLRTIGTVLGVADRADELRRFAENTIINTRGVLLIRPVDTRPRVYYALGPDGLTTPLPGVPAAQAIAEAGAINVAAPLGRSIYTRISRDQLLAWNPDIIIAQYPRFYDALRRDGSWRRLAAVRNHKVYLEPEGPFGWIDDPPGINRLVGLSWLSTLFYPEPTREELRGTVCEFYDRFYRVRLTNAQLGDILAPAGIPRPEPARANGAPLGLGPAPSVPGPAVPGAAPSPGISSPVTPLAGTPPPADFGTAPNAAGTLPALPPELAPAPSGPGARSSSGAVPVIPGTETGTPGAPSAPPLPSLPDQPDALCTIPGIAAPITGLPAAAPLTGGPVPGGRARQPGAGGLPPADLPPDLAYPTGPLR